MNRITKYDILRVIACFSIVLLHVSASYWSVVDVHSKEFLIMTIYNSLTRFAVPVFFMLSGLFSCFTTKREFGNRKTDFEITGIILCLVGFLRFSRCGN